MDANRKTLSPGTRLGNFELTELLGEGGMGQVYLARDSKLGREVAIKVLPEHTARDEQSLERFEREARLLATTSHPNIAVLHGLERDGDRSFLVMELVPGLTLEEKLRPAALDIKEALSIFGQVAEGLEAAHDQGVVHRDLKPANIKVTDQGRVKILDFGLARTTSTVISSAGDDGTVSLGVAGKQITSEGMVVGTPAYMSPEQARGKPVDKRTDIWAFGCCLFEAISGRSPFRGETSSDTLALILEVEPDWSALPASTPIGVRVLLRRCLEKDPRERLHDIADARLEISDARDPSRVAVQNLASVSPETVSRGRPLLSWVLTAILTLVVIWLALGRAPEAPRAGLSILTAPLPSGVALDLVEWPLAISPDGSRIAFMGTRGGRKQVYLRALNEEHARLLPGTENKFGPFFSPDGQWLGFFDYIEGMKRIPVDGGQVTAICEAVWPHGASWGPRSIVFNPGPARKRGLRSVEPDRVESDGRSERLLDPTDDEGELTLLWPQVLADGQVILYTSRTSEPLEDSRIVVEHLATGNRVIAVPKASNARYVPTGHIVYAHGGALWAVRFELERMEVRGPPKQVVPDLLMSPFFAAGVFAISSSGSGTLVYARVGSEPPGRRLAWVGLDGKAEPIDDLKPDAYVSVQLSSQANQLLVAIGSTSADVWVVDLNVAKRRTKITQSPMNDFEPIWTHGGKRIIFCSDRTGSPDIYWTTPDGVGDASVVLDTDSGVRITWSPTEKVLAYVEFASMSSDIWLFDPEVDQEPRQFSHTSHRETLPRFSPTGPWLAFQSDKNHKDRFEIYVTRYPEFREIPVSVGEGHDPVWSPDGKRLYYRTGDRMMVVENSGTDSEFRPSEPQVVFPLPGVVAEERPQDGRKYDVASDGDEDKFIMIMENALQPGRTELVVVQNWFAELERLLPDDE